MSNYTAEQVAMVADYLHNTDGDMEAVEMLRAYAATLRQQAGRVDEVLLERMAAARWEVSRTTLWDKVQPEVRQDEIAQMRAALDVAWPTAALAQNTQGVPEVEHKALEKLVTAAVLMLAEIDTCGHEVDPAYRLALYEAWEEGKAALAAAPSHSAERARVPADMVLVPCEPTREMLCAWRNAEGSDAYYNTGEGIGYCYKAMIAAAPSQRAEVKS